MTSSQIASTSSHVDASRLGLPSIAFVGKAGAGKSTAAQLLVDLLGYQRMSFAAPLKILAASLWGEEAKTDRDKLQKLGVAVRIIERDTWVNLMLDRLSAGTAAWNSLTYRPVLPIAVDDLRFENEWHALKGAGFVVVRISSERHRRTDRLKAIGKFQDEAQLDHVSETAVDHLVADHLITNDGDLIDFESQILDVVMKERKRR